MLKYKLINLLKEEDMKALKGIILLFLIVINIIFSACSNNNSSSVPTIKQGEDSISKTLEISFPYVKQKGYATNQFAVWIENESGEYIKTIFVTKFTATKGYEKRKDAIPTWVEKSNISDGSTQEIDTVTGSTPKKSAYLVYVWDCKDKDGNEVPKGVYNYYVEGTVKWESRVLYSGKIEVGGIDSSSEAKVEYSTEEAKESDMIGEVKAVYNK